MAFPAFADALDELCRGEVDLIVVGMAAAILQGAPMMTQDIDVVHRRTPENVDRLLRVLTSLDAVYRTDRRGIRPTASHLLGVGHNLFTTRAGDLDCLGTIGDALSYEDLEHDTIILDLGSDLRCRVLTLSRLIEVKQQAGRPKDLAVLPALRATLAEISKR